MTFPFPNTQGGHAITAASADPTALLAISSLEAWYDAGNNDDETYCWTDTGMTAAAGDTDHFLRWQDRSGNGYHLANTSAAESSQPVFYEGGSDSRPYVQSSADLVSIAPVIPSILYPVTLVLLVEQNLPDGSPSYPMPANKYQMYNRPIFTPTAYDLSSRFYSGGWQTNTVWNDVEPTDGSLWAFSMTIPDDAGPELRVAGVSGGQGGGAVVTVSSQANTNWDAWTWGYSAGLPIKNFPVQMTLNIYEFMIFSEALDASDIQTVFQYLAAAHPSLVVSI